MNAHSEKQDDKAIEQELEAIANEGKESAGEAMEALARKIVEGRAEKARREDALEKIKEEVKGWEKELVQLMQNFNFLSFRVEGVGRFDAKKNMEVSLPKAKEDEFKDLVFDNFVEKSDLERVKDELQFALDSGQFEKSPLAKTLALLDFWKPTFHSQSLKSFVKDLKESNPELFEKASGICSVFEERKLAVTTEK